MTRYNGAVIRQCGRVMSSGKGRLNRLRIVIGVLVLMFGAAVYLTDRGPRTAYFLPRPLSGAFGSRAVFGVAAENLPTFAHVVAFTLITAGVLAVGRRGGLVVASVWCVTDVAFELGQHSSISPHLARHVPAWFSGIPFLENTRFYFAAGTFDPRDVISILLGAIVAYLVIAVTCSKGERQWVSTPS